MSRRIVVSALLLTGMSTVAMAQEAPYSHTLNEQLSRVRQGQPAIPGSNQPQRAQAPAALQPSADSSADAADDGVEFAPAASDTPAPQAAPVPAAAAAAGKPVSPRVNQMIQYDDAPEVVAAPTPQHLPSHMIDSVGGGAIPALPLQVQQSGDIKYVTGGVGDEELAQLKAAAGEYNVQILMTSQNGPFLSEMMLRLFSKDNQILVSAENAGPYFYAQLKPGVYTLEMTTPQGNTQYAKFTVGKGLVKQQVRFK